MVMAAAATTPVVAQAPRVASEYDVKAAFLYNFAGFVSWPASAFPTAGSPFVVGVLGEDPFAGRLESTIRGETINGHPMVYRRVTGLDQMRACHILFVGTSELARHADVLSDLRGSPVLTVGESEQFLGSGGMIRLVVVERRVGFEVNLSAASKSGIRPSGRLLKVARRVIGA
ncbi:MAG: YfiR family protein [Armatimonadetes bacterium]|nr:YfiR family protein [Armatimonadota bacterium]